MVVDLENSPWLDKDFIKSLIPILGNYFPDLLYKMFLINASFVMRSAWNVIYRFLHPVTQKKITLIGSGKNEILKLLKTEINDDEIPKKLGGQFDIEL